MPRPSIQLDILTETTSIWKRIIWDRNVWLKEGARRHDKKCLVVNDAVIGESNGHAGTVINWEGVGCGSVQLMFRACSDRWSADTCRPRGCARGWAASRGSARARARSLHADMCRTYAESIRTDILVRYIADTMVWSSSTRNEERHAPGRCTSSRAWRRCPRAWSRRPVPSPGGCASSRRRSRRRRAWARPPAHVGREPVCGVRADMH